MSRAAQHHEVATDIPDGDCRVQRVAIGRFAVAAGRAKYAAVEMTLWRRPDGSSVRASRPTAATGWPAVGQSVGRSRSTDWPVRTRLGCAARSRGRQRSGQVTLARLRRASRRQAPRSLRASSPQVEPVHLVLQRAQRNAEVAGGGGDVPAGLLERPQDEVALEGVAALPRTGCRRSAGAESSWAKWNSSGRSSSVIQSLSLTATSRSIRFSSSRMLPGHQYALQDLQRRVGDAADRLAELRAL